LIGDFVLTFDYVLRKIGDWLDWEGGQAVFFFVVACFDIQHLAGGDQGTSLLFYGSKYV
jgi:hypothetical protein